MKGVERSRGGWTSNQVSPVLYDDFWSRAHTPKDGFETLCHVAADVSAAPSTRKVGRFGKICYDREYDVVLLVGLTELKAQIRWFNNVTVRIRD